MMDEILRRKLLADGEGSGEDRRMQMLMKNVVNLFNSIETKKSGMSDDKDEKKSSNNNNDVKDSNIQENSNDQRVSASSSPPTPSENSVITPSSLKNNLYKIQNLLQQCETSAMKSALIHVTANDESAFYGEMAKVLTAEIDNAHARIVQCKKELADAKQIRKQRQEYDALGLLIKKHVPRSETSKRLALLKQQKKLALEKRDQCSRRIEEWKKHFHVLMLSLQEIRTRLPS